MSIRFQSWWRRGEYDLNGRIFYYTPLALLPPMNFPLVSEKWALDNWHRFTCPNVIEFIKSAGFGQIDLLVVDSVIQEFLLRAIKVKRSLAEDHG